MGLVETAKDIAELVQKSDNIELVRKILTLQQEVMEQQEGTHKLRGQIRELEDRLRDKRRLVFRENCYWDHETDDGPFCSACFDLKRITMRMHQDRGRHTCPGCHEFVVTEANRARTDAMVRAHNEGRGGDY